MIRTFFVGPDHFSHGWIIIIINNVVLKRIIIIITRPCLNSHQYTCGQWVYIDFVISYSNLNLNQIILNLFRSVYNSNQSC